MHSEQTCFSTKSDTYVVDAADLLATNLALATSCVIAQAAPSLVRMAVTMAVVVVSCPVVIVAAIAAACSSSRLAVPRLVMMAMIVLTTLVRVSTTITAPSGGGCCLLFLDELLNFASRAVALKAVFLDEAGPSVSVGVAQRHVRYCEL